MFELIPSKYMRGIFKKHGFEMTDFNKATVIWNRRDKSWEERISALEELTENTQDQILKSQINKRVAFENEKLRRFKENLDKKYVYVIENNDGYNTGYFFDYLMAYEYGLSYMKNENEERIKIKKQLIVESEEVESYDGWQVADISLTPDKKVYNVWSDEMPYEDEHFENQFFEIPFEGFKGVMPVRDIVDEDGEVGILMEGTKEWQDYLNDIKKRNLYVDYSDIQVEVVYLTSQGLWSHEHINPIFLEHVSVPCECGNPKSEVYGRAMEAFMEYYSAKAEGKKDLASFSKRVIDAARAYRDICIQEETEQHIMKCRIVDSANEVEELIV